jgi:diguanylate cyclase (GGDEF)-like protein
MTKAAAAPLRGNARLALLGAVLSIAIAAADWQIIAMERDASISDFQTATTNLANGMTAQTTRALGAADLLLLNLRKYLAARQDAGSDPGATRALSDLLAEWRQRVGSIDAMGFVNPSGRLVGSSAEPAPDADVSGRDFVRHVTAAPDTGAFIGAPRRDPITGRWTSTLARRVDRQDGSFAGVVFADLALGDIEGFYRIAMPAHRTITLARGDGVVLARYPHDATAIGRQVPAASMWYKAVAAGGGAYVGPGLFDDEPVIAIVRPLHGLPLVIETSVTEADALAGWSVQRIWLELGGGAACLGVMLLLRLFGVQLRRLALKNAQLDEARGQLQVAMSNIPQGLCFYDGNQRLIVCNRRYGEIYHLPPHALRSGAPLADIVDHCYAAGGIADVSREDYLMSRAAIARNRDAHHSVIVTGDGRTIAIQQQPMADGGWVATHEDITERRHAEEKISFLAQHDVLTGLPNRSLLMERIGEARAHALRGAHFALLFLDLDRFKAVNDTLGHAAGDELLRSVAGRLLAEARDGDTVARLGGDEFVVLQPNLASPGSAAVLAERIIDAIGAPYMIAGQEVVIGVSIGIDIGTKDHASPGELLKNADMALYISKGEGRGIFRFFEPEMDARVQNRHALERDLRCALTRGEFELFYQPIANARSGETCGFEALLRWNHPARGLVAPADFIPVAEECGLIIELGEWVIRQACRQAALWPEDVHLAVNLSPVQFRAANLVSVVHEALTAAGIDARRLELEMTESVLLQSNPRNMAVMHQLRASGIGIVMDDFGVGTSSLRLLRSFPFDRVKIDQSFVSDLTTTDDAIFIVRAIIGLCRNLGIRTTAEGVENAEQLDILLEEGCTELQGALFSRPQQACDLDVLHNGARLIKRAIRDRGLVGTNA